MFGVHSCVGGLLLSSVFDWVLLITVLQGGSLSCHKKGISRVVPSNAERHDHRL